MNTSMLRTRWAAVGAAVAITLGAGGLGISYATSPTGAVAFVPITPCRVLDTRPAPDNIGNRSTPIGAGESHAVTAHGDNGACTDLPVGATGLSLNVTTLGATSPTFVTLWATGAAQPTASNLNPQPGQPPTPNAVTTGISAVGQFNVFNAFGTVDVIIDIVGYYTDHDHDDRYYTETEADARFLGIAQDSQADVDGGDGSTAMTGTDVIMATVTVQTPTSGYVIANSSVTLFGSGALGAARCSITTGTAIDANALQQAYADSNQRQMLSGTRGLTVNKALLFGSDTMTVNLVCDGIGGSPVLEDPQLNATFIPDPDAFGLIFIPVGEAQADDGSDG